MKFYKIDIKNRTATPATHMIIKEIEGNFFQTIYWFYKYYIKQILLFITDYNLENAIEHIN